MSRPAFAFAASVVLATQALTACGGASDRCNAASDYVWLVDYGAGQHGGPPADTRDGIRLAERLLEVIDDLDRTGPDTLDADLANVKTVWTVSLEELQAGSPERIPARVLTNVTGGAAAAQESGRNVVAWAKETCGEGDSWGQEPDEFQDR